MRQTVIIPNLIIMISLVLAYYRCLFNMVSIAYTGNDKELVAPVLYFAVYLYLF